uniref:Serpentine receptor class gamma n=1 Tax=Acrobeloides nanus TaxID=290746 RepID=A0A914DX74_9BILA
MSEYCASLQPKSSAESFDVRKLNIQSLVPLSYGIPTCILYIMVICILLSKKGRQEFKGSFYACFAVAGIIVSWKRALKGG